MAYIIMATQKRVDDNSAWEINLGGCRSNRRPPLHIAEEIEFLRVFPLFKKNEKSGEMTLVYKKETGTDVPVPPLAFIQEIIHYLKRKDSQSVSSSTHVCSRTGRPNYTWTIA